MAKKTEHFCKEICGKWKETLQSPTKFFAKETKPKNLNYAFKGIVVAGIISAIISILAVSASSQFNALATTLSWPVYAVVTLIITPLAGIIGLIIGSGILYIFAKLLGGKGTYTVQTHIMAFSMAAFSIISALIGVITTLNANLLIVTMVLSLLVGIYNLYVLTIGLKASHKYSTGKAVLTWLIPAIIILAIFAVLMIGVFMPLAAHYGTLSSGLTPAA